MSPRFSIVIPAFNEEFELPATLAAFDAAVREYRRQDASAEFEFIVVDNASTDATARIASAWGAHVVHEPHRQIARARNAGARVATGEILITCDADSRPHPRIFQTIESRLASGVFAGGVRIWASPMRLRHLPVFVAVNLVCVIARLPAGMYFMKRTDFLALGGFDETLYALEDVDLAKRLKREARRRGKKISILWNRPIHTSTRKFRLSRSLDWIRMGLLVAIRPNRYLKDRRYWEPLYYSSALRESETIAP